MGPLPPSILITTTHKASDEARILCKTLEHIIPNSKHLTRGSRNQNELLEISKDMKAEYIFICHSQGSKVSELRFFKTEREQIYELNHWIKIYEFIDHKIFGWKSLPENGPLSVSREVRNKNPKLVDYLEKMFRVRVGEKTSLWLLVDATELEGYLQFVDALTVKPFSHLRIKILMVDK